MTENKIDFNAKEKTIPMSEFKKDYSWVEEPYVSPDGEKIAAVVQAEEEVFSVICSDDKERKKWEDVDKVWKLNFLPDNRLSAFISSEGAWTVGIDNVLWEDGYDFIWKPLVSANGKGLAISANNGGEYMMILNGKGWEQGFENMTNTAISPLGNKTAACVQVTPAGEGEIFKFQEGVFSVAVDGKVWDSKFVNVWDLSFSDDEQSVAAEVRTSLYDYTIAVDGKAWAGKYKSIWKPIFRPNTKSVITTAQSFEKGKWGLVEDDKFIWNPRFFQCWSPVFSPDASKIAAIVSPDYGKWTVAVDDKVWSSCFTSYLTDLSFSQNGKTVAAVYMNDNQKSSIVVDDKPWSTQFDTIEEYTVSPDGKNIFAVGKKDGKYSIILNDKVIDSDMEKAWKPIFNEDGSKVILKILKDDVYYRKVLNV